MPQENERANSGFRAFWSSLPGVLTGAAGVIAAVGTVAALFIGGGDTQPRAPGVAAPAAAVRASGDSSCFDAYFKGIPRDRVGEVEVGDTAYDVIQTHQPKAGTIGMTFTSYGRPIGAIRFGYFAASDIFKIESIVDARCAPTEDFENLAGDEKHVLQDSGTVRIGLGGKLYDLNANGGSLIRISFVSVVP